MKRLRIVLFFLSLPVLGQTTGKKFQVLPYGFLKSSAIYADGAIGSYNNINLSAPTFAVPKISTINSSSRLSFQTQQSRIGFEFKKAQVSGKFEFDFIDFNKASPTTQMNPRVRIAAVTYQIDSQNKFIMGQDWDLFAPVTSYTYDIVGLYFLAGNSGFMRQQFQFLHQLNEWELGAALGMAGNNPGTVDTNLEQGKTPSYSVRASKQIEGGKFGVSAIYSSLEYLDVNGARHDSYGINLFYEKLFGNFGLKSETYYGQNMANIGLLTIGKGTATQNVREYGGFLTANYKLNEKNSVFGGIGGAFVTRADDVKPFSLKVTNDIVDSPGITSNIVSRLAWEYRFTPDFSWITEVTRFQTTTALSENKKQLNVVPTVESGILLFF